MSMSMSMRMMRAMLLGMSLLGASATWAAAQGVVAVQWLQDEDDRQAFREGYRQGRWDAQHGRRADWDDNRWREADDRRWYREGYLRGYREVSNNDYDGRFYAESARRFGYEDGYNDGRRDLRTGHSFRPTHDDHYEDADRGYDGRFGHKSYYKQVYREGYRQGYEQGYNSGWRY
jgi:hypothetical protein